MTNNIIATNKRAHFEYTFSEKYEAGLKLTGAEVRAAKSGQINLTGSYAVLGLDGRARLLGCHIAPYKPAAAHQREYDPNRSRELLLTKKEIKGLYGKLKEKRFSLIPLTVYNKNGLIKIGLGLGVGKKQYEKREVIKKRDIEREIGRRLRR